MTSILTTYLPFPKRTVIAALVMVLIALLAQTITIMYRMAWAPARLMTHSMSRPVARPSAVPVSVQAHAAPAAVPAASSSDFRGLPLNSNYRSYHLVMNGQVVCGTKGCPAQLQAIVSSTTNPDMHKVLETNSQGFYELTFAFKELPHEQIDWKITAINNALGTAESHGRQILTDDSTVELPDTLEIHS